MVTIFVCALFQAWIECVLDQGAEENTYTYRDEVIGGWRK
jgi:hypothetical protein